MTEVHVFNLSVYDNVGRLQQAREYWHDCLCEDMYIRGRSAGVKVRADLRRLKVRLRKHPDDIWFVRDPATSQILGVLFAVCETTPAPRMIVYSAADRNTKRGKVDQNDGREWCDVFNELLERLAKSNHCTSIIYQGPATWAEHFPSRVVGDEGFGGRCASPWVQ